MKCDELKSLWVYSRDINENCDEEFVNFAKENGYEELVEKKEVTEAIAELKEFAEDACLERDDNQTAIDELQSENRKLKDKLQNVSSLLNQTREWLLESQKLHKKCADNAVKVIRHQKYKRCLAMARMCEERSARYDALQEGHDLDWRREIEFYYKWYMRWLELAMKFELKNGVNNA